MLSAKIKISPHKRNKLEWDKTGAACWPFLWTWNAHENFSLEMHPSLVCAKSVYFSSQHKFFSFLFVHLIYNYFWTLIACQIYKYEKGPVPTQPEPTIWLGRQTYTSITLDSYKAVVPSSEQQVENADAWNPPHISQMKISRPHRVTYHLYFIQLPSSLRLILKHNKDWELLIARKEHWA